MNAGLTFPKDAYRPMEQNWEFPNTSSTFTISWFSIRVSRPLNRAKIIISYQGWDQWLRACTALPEPSSISSNIRWLIATYNFRYRGPNGSYTWLLGLQLVVDWEELGCTVFSEKVCHWKKSWGFKSLLSSPAYSQCLLLIDSDETSQPFPPSFSPPHSPPWW